MLYYFRRTPLEFDSKQPRDMLQYIATFAGFCDLVDETKNAVYREFILFAVEYFRYFKGATKKERLAQYTDSTLMRAEIDLIHYVDNAEDEEQFLEDLINDSANMSYLWQTTSEQHGMSHYSQRQTEILELASYYNRRITELNRSSAELPDHTPKRGSSD